MLEGQVKPNTYARKSRLCRYRRTLKWSTGELSNGKPYFEILVDDQPVVLEPHDVMPLINALFEFMAEVTKPKE